MGQLLSNLANGSLVKLAENSKPTKFIKLTMTTTAPARA